MSILSIPFMGYPWKLKLAPGATKSNNFQFPLWDTGGVAPPIKNIKKLYFQFPLWDTPPIL